MNETGVSYTAQPRYTHLLDAVTLLLANLLLMEDGADRTDSVDIAARLLRDVFAGKNIALMKFVRNATGMPLVDAKNFVLNHIKVDDFPYSYSMIDRMRNRHVNPS